MTSFKDIRFAATIFFSVIIVMFTLNTVNASDRVSTGTGKGTKGVTFKNISALFLKDTVSQVGNSYSFNSITISNNGSSTQDIAIEVTPPDGWQLIFDNRRIYRLAPNEVIQVPVRIAATNNSAKSINPVKVSFKHAGYYVAEYTYFAKVQSNSKWQANLITPELRLSRESSETLFQVAFVNQGNVPEEFTVNFATNLMLTPGRLIKFKLDAGKDTVLTMGIITELKRLNEFKPQVITVKVKTDNDSKQLEQRVYSYGTIFKQNQTQWYNLPLSVEFVGQNSPFGGSTFALNGTGTLNLGDARKLAFNYRSDNFYSDLSGSTKYSNLDYTSKNFSISLGDHADFDHFFIDGQGLKVKYGKERGYGIELTAVDSRYGDAKQFSVHQRYTLGRDEEIRNRSLVNLDRLTGRNSYLSIVEYDKYFGNNSHLILEAGTGVQTGNIFQKSMKGSTAGISFNVNYPTLTFSTHTAFSTKGFPGMNEGALTSSSELRLIEKNKFAGVILRVNQREKSILDTNTFLPQYQTKNQEVGIKTGTHLKRGYVILTASGVRQRLDSLSARSVFSKKLNLYTSLYFGKTGSFTLSANAFKNHESLLKGGSKSYSFNGFGTLQSRNMGLVFSYDFGPNFYSEYRFRQIPGNVNNRKQVSPFIERTFFKSVVTARVQVDYQSDRLMRTTSIVSRADININLNKKGLNIRLFGSREMRKNVLKQDYLSMSIRKSFRLPVLGVQKYKSLKVVLFKDNNSNDVYDLGDQPLEKADIQIGNQHFTTNQKGEAVYQNINKGKYSIELGQLAAVKGWIAKNGFRQSVEVENNMTQYIPFKKSKLLEGRLNIVKDEFSSQKFNPANIRITAINSKGESFDTFTSEQGTFSFNLPSDTYLVRINSNVFNDSFRVLQYAQNIDLLTNGEEAIAFEIREKKRKINMNTQITYNAPKTSK